MSVQSESLGVSRERLIESLEYEIRAAEAYAKAHSAICAVTDYCEGKIVVLNELLFAARNGAWS